MSTELATASRIVAGLLGATALVLVTVAGGLADWIDRDRAPASLILTLALASLVAAGLAAVGPGAWRLVCLAAAAVPLLWILSVVASVA